MRGSLPIKVRIPGCEPIRRLSGTYDKKVVRKLKNMVHAFHEQGRDDLVNAIARGTIKPLQAYNLWKFNRLDQLPHAEELPRFADAYARWLREAEIGDDWRDACEGYGRRLQALMPPDARVGAVVEALKEYRNLKRDHPRSFQMARMAVQSFLRHTLTRRHRLWLDVTAIPLLKVRPTRTKHPMTVERLRGVVRELGDPYGAEVWTMAITGMGRREYEGPWEREGEGLRIHGTKTGGRDRLIPYVSVLYPCTSTIWMFRRRLRAVGITPYDCRRTFANLMVESQIPSVRRALYMGHTHKSMTELYEWHEVKDYLLRDAERMRAVLGEPVGGPSLQVVRA